SGAIQPKPVNISAATAWTRRQLIFEFTPLAEVAEEFNRYNIRKLAVEGDPLRSFKISAVFSSADPAALVKFLRGMPEVRVSDTGTVITIAPRQATSK